MIKFVVYVREQALGAERRFEFDSGDQAWDCYAAAIAAGFFARGVKVQSRKRELINA